MTKGSGSGTRGIVSETNRRKGINGRKWTKGMGGRGEGEG